MNGFRYIPENDIEGDILVWTPPSTLCSHTRVTPTSLEVYSPSYPSNFQYLLPPSSFKSLLYHFCYWTHDYNGCPHPSSRTQARRAFMAQTSNRSYFYSMTLNVYPPLLHDAPSNSTGYVIHYPCQSHPCNSS